MQTNKLDFHLIGISWKLHEAVLKCKNKKYIIFINTKASLNVQYEIINKALENGEIHFHVV